MKKYLMILTLFGLTACTTPQPYVDAYSGIANGHALRRSTADKVAICFDDTDMKTLQQMADTECAKTSRKAIYDSTAPFSCSLTTPSTVYFNCR